MYMHILSHSACVCKTGTAYSREKMNKKEHDKSMD